MADWFLDCSAITQALVAGVFTWSFTACGALTVFFARDMNRRLLDSMLGFAAGVMMAASYWSLLAPSIEIAEHGSLPEWFPATIGLLTGAGCLWIIDKSLPQLHPMFPLESAEGPGTTWNRAVLLVLAAQTQFSRVISLR